MARMVERGEAVVERRVVPAQFALIQMNMGREVCRRLFSRAP